MNINRKRNSFLITAMGTGLVLALQIVCPPRLQAQGDTPKYEVDPSWPSLVNSSEARIVAQKAHW
jgi:hypothetical protein